MTTQLVISQSAFLKFLSTSGITITQLSDYKNTATNMVQELRQPFRKTEIYSRTFKPTNWSINETVEGYVPSIDNLKDVIEIEGKLNAFNEFSTKVMEAHRAEKTRILNFKFMLPAFQYDDTQIIALNAAISELYDNKPEMNYIERPVKREVMVSLEDYLSGNDLYSYLLYNQTASALGNLILHDETKSRDARNFLYNLFEQEYISFVKGDTLHRPMLSRAELKPYHEMFFSIQGEHREFEKKKNFLKVKYQQFIHDAEKSALEDYVAASISYEKLMNDEQSRYTAESVRFNSKVDELKQNYSALVKQRSEAESGFIASVKSEHESARKSLEQQFYGLKVWLPESAREVVKLIDAKRKD